MSHFGRSVFCVTLFCLCVLPAGPAARSAEKKAIVQGAEEITGAPQPFEQEPAAQLTAPSASPTKSPPLIRMLEGKEGDLWIWIALGLAIFIIGWISGGNYYLRRDRNRRTRIRF